MSFQIGMGSINNDRFPREVIGTMYGSTLRYTGTTTSSTLSTSPSTSRSSAMKLMRRRKPTTNSFSPPFLFFLKLTNNFTQPSTNWIRFFKGAYDFSLVHPGILDSRIPADRGVDLQSTFKATNRVEGTPVQNEIHKPSKDLRTAEPTHPHTAPTQRAPITPIQRFKHLKYTSQPRHASQEHDTLGLAHVRS